MAGKRLMDLVLVILSLPVWLPLFILVALYILIRDGRPLFFRQERAGFHGKPFRIIKFRTMTEFRDESGRLLSDEERLPRWGKRLRSLSLDEIPEFINVISGQMSLVGPRPLPIHYLPRYSKEQSRRHDCLPGITGWAQINGRNAVEWEERFKLDLWYVDNRSWLLDLKILFLTFWTVLRRRGIAAEGSATMHEFMGTPDAPPHRQTPGKE